MIEQPEVWTFAAAAMRELTRGEDGWPRGWCGGGWEAHRGDDSVFEATVVFDRDRCDVETARAWARQVEAKFRAAYPEASKLSLYVMPATRIEVVLGVVKDHFETMAIREEDKMKRGGKAWVTVGEIEVKRGWRLDEDRVVADMYADSSVDEEAARQLGTAWFAKLVEEWPEMAEVVEVTGSSH